MRSNSGIPRVGLGIYHSGIEVFGREISFGYADAGMTGVFEVPPRCAPGVMPRTTFKESVVLGYMFRSAFEVDHILQRMASSYRGTTYHLVRRNCNHFANELGKTLVGKGIPPYVNRIATFGKRILGVLALPSQAFGGMMAGIKKVKKGADVARERTQTSPARDTSGYTSATSSPMANAVVASPSQLLTAENPALRSAQDLRGRMYGGRERIRDSDEIMS